MKNLPIPTDLPWEVQLLIYVLVTIITLLFGACLWWLMRFIKNHDDFKSDVSASLTEHADKMDAAVKKVKETSDQLKESAQKFERDSQTQLMSVHKQVVDMNASVEIGKNKIELMGKQLDSIQKTSDHNQEALKKSSDILTIHQRLIDQNRAVLATVIKKLGHDKFMVSSKKSEEEE